VIDSSSGDVRRTPWKWLVRLGLGLIVLGLLISHKGSAATVLTTLRRFSLPLLAIAIAGYWIGQAICAWKWRLLLRARHIEADLPLCCRLYLAGMFGNLWLPTNVGGDALRAYLMHRARPGAGLGTVAASVLVERLTGLAALLGLASFGLAWNGMDNPSVLSLLGFGTMVLAALVTGLAAARKTGAKWATEGKLARGLAALEAYAQPQNRAALVRALFLSLIFQASQVVLNIWLAHEAGLRLPAPMYWWLVPALALSGLIPVGVGGLGVREAAAVALVHGSGIPAPASVIIGWSLLWQATIWLSSLPGALFLKPHAIKSCHDTGIND